MPKQLLQLLQNISWAIFQSLVFFAIAYLVWFVIKKTLQKKLTATLEFTLLFFILLTGTVQFLLIALGYQINKPAEYLYISGLNDSSIIFNLFGVFYLLFLCCKLIGFFQKNRPGKKVDYIPFIHHDLNNYIVNLSNYLKIRAPQIFVTAKHAVPYTKGFIKKIIVLPVSFISRLNEQELEAVLLHEIAHIKRLDHFTNLLLVFSDIVLHFNPFVKILLKEIKLQRELACDDWVLEQNIRPKYYATALQKSAQVQQQENSFQIAMGVKKNELLFRIQRLYKEHKTNYFSFHRLPFLSLVLLFLLPAQRNIPSLNNLFSAVRNLPLPVTENTKIRNFEVSNGNSTKSSAKKGVQNIKRQSTGTIIKLPLIEDMIAVSNKQENFAYKTEIHTTRSKINDLVLQLEDSILLFEPEISKENILDATMLPLTNLLTTIASMNELASENLAFAAEPSTITVTQNGLKNLYYNNVRLQQTLVFNATTGKWNIRMELHNDQTIIGKRYIAVSLVKKLNTISL